ncbi:stealth conserved region 3 domain-containing protein [Muriiphilus fusiformis]|uniref:Stealth protein CR3 conserved region 3 domain-containing protein n=1 Tax=Maritimibacter fusiformis TaxID=2603819 RepID=A0A5D0RN93_9RHOB|nr:hypothetical protein FVF75_02230 [Maritimibacter fusiformis]
MFQLEKDFPEAWEATLPNKFRSPYDFSIAGALYQQYAAALGRAVPGSIRYSYVDTKVPIGRAKTRRLLRDDWIRPQMFCVNDTIETEKAAKNKRDTMGIVEKVLPVSDGKIVKLTRGPQALLWRWGLWGPRA